MSDDLPGGGADGGLGMSGGDGSPSPKATNSSSARASPSTSEGDPPPHDSEPVQSSVSLDGMEGNSLEQEHVPLPQVEPITDRILDLLGAFFERVLLYFWALLPRSFRIQAEKIGITPPKGAEHFELLVSGDRGCAIIGPTNSGKTTFIAALQQACNYRRPGQLDLRFGSQHDCKTAVSELIKKAIRTICDPKSDNGEQDGRIQATSGSPTYGLWIEGARTFAGREDRAVFRLSFRFRDGPGGAIFPTSFPPDPMIRQELVQHIRTQANLLVICLDATTLSVEYLRNHLLDLLSELCLNPARDRPRLRAERVLLLLNKVDVLCVRWCEGTEQHLRQQLADQGLSEEEITFRLQQMASRLPRPLTLARQLDPIAQAKEVIGLLNLKTLYDHLHPDARLAVGLCSTSGFDQNGDAFLDSAGWPKNRPYASIQDRFLQEWQPFGIREAIEFLALGQEADCLHILHPDDLYHNPSPAKRLDHIMQQVISQ